MQADDLLLPRRLLRLEYCKQNQGSSEKTTMRVRRTRIVVSLCCIVKDDELVVADAVVQATLLQTSIHRASGNWSFCKHAHFLTNGRRYSYTILQRGSHNVSPPSPSVHHNPRQPFLPYSYDNEWMSINSMK